MCTVPGKRVDQFRQADRLLPGKIHQVKHQMDILTGSVFCPVKNKFVNQEGFSCCCLSAGHHCSDVCFCSCVNMLLIFGSDGFPTAVSILLMNLEMGWSPAVTSGSSRLTVFLLDVHPSCKHLDVSCRFGCSRSLWFLTGCGFSMSL